LIPSIGRLATAGTRKSRKSARAALEQLYLGNSRRARLFRYGLLAFDVGTILFFIVSSMMPGWPYEYAADALIALAILADSPPGSGSPPTSAASFCS